MMHLLIKRTINILIGLKFYGLLFIILSLSSCGFFEWDVQPHYNYSAICLNKTNDTLVVSFNNRAIIPSQDLLFPDSSISLASIGVMKGEEPLHEIFKEWNGWDSCWVYKINSEILSDIKQYYGTDKELIYPKREDLVVVWDAPIRDFGDTTNHFFNSGAWDSWLTDNNKYGIVQFTIYESDLNQQ